jgi:histidine phosphotransferase ChpT
LLLNLFLVAYGAIPRGGEIDIVLETPETDPKFRLVSKGRMVRVPPKFLEIYSGDVDEAIDAHSIQPYYTVLLAEESGMTLSCSANADEVVFTAQRTESAAA